MKKEIEPKTSEILTLAKSYIASESNWIKYKLALNSRGGNVLPWEKEAVCFCSVGAVEKAISIGFPEYTSSVVRDINNALQRAINRLYPFKHFSIVSFNDSSETTHAHVLEVFDLAIKLAKEHGD